MKSAWVCGVDDAGVRSVCAQLPMLRSTIIRDENLPEELPDVCILVASAEQGASPALVDAWHRCAEEFIPRICVWTHIDTGRVDDDEMRAIAERMLEEDVFALSLPISGDDEEFIGVLDLPTQRLHVAGDGEPRDSDAEHVSLSMDARDDLLHAAAATVGDDPAIEQLALGLTLDAQRAWELVAQGVATGQLVVAAPVKPVGDAVGVDVLAELLDRIGAFATEANESQ